MADDTYEHFDSLHWEKTYVAVGQASSTSHWHKAIREGEEDVQISKCSVWVGHGMDEERTCEEKSV